MNKGSSRGFGFANQDVRRGDVHPGHGMGVFYCAHDNRFKGYEDCFIYSLSVHVAQECPIERSWHGYRRIILEMYCRDWRAAILEPGSNVWLY
jgi:hypothetical protein